MPMVRDIARLRYPTVELCSLLHKPSASSLARFLIHHGAEFNPQLSHPPPSPRCHTCIYSGQRRLRPSHLLVDDVASTAHVDDTGALRVGCLLDSHAVCIAPIDVAALHPRATCAASDNNHATQCNMTTPCHGAQRGLPPPRDFASVVDDDGALFGWLLDLAAHGAAVLRNAPSRDPHVVRVLADRVSQPQVCVAGV